MSPTERGRRTAGRPDPHRPIGVIDVGTNSVKLVVGRATRAGVETLHFARATTRLGEGLSRGRRITPAAAARTAAAVRAMEKEARKHGAAEVIAVGTWALRTAANGRAVAKAIGAGAGLPVRVLTGREEATLAYAAACARLPHPKPRTFLLDIGGGSAEFVAARAGVVHLARSVPLGALRLTETHLGADPVTAAQHAALRRAIDRAVSRLLARVGPFDPRAVDFVASGGAVTTALDMTRGRVGAHRRPDGRVTLAQLRRLESLCLGMTIAQRRSIPGLPADRADIILAGLSVAISFLEHARKRALVINGGGLREGIILALSESGARSRSRTRARARSRGAARKSR
jgi:exopolyphosphatase/guanosine-5'-triphosphate,3'-diphosphate pyrophosphatase